MVELTYTAQSKEDIDKTSYSYGSPSHEFPVLVCTYYTIFILNVHTFVECWFATSKIKIVLFVLIYFRFFFDGLKI